MISMIILCVINSLFAVSAIVSNTVILLAIVLTPRLHNPSNILLCGLAISDFGVGFFVQPIFTIYLLGYREALKSFLALTALFFGGISITTMALLAVDRCLALYLHLRYHTVITNKRTLIFIILMWLKVGLVLIQIQYGNYKVSIGLIAGLELVDFSIAIVSYLAILRIVRRHKRQIHSQMQAFNRSTVKQGRSLVTMFYVHAIFVLCGLPFAVTLLYVALADENDRSEVIFSSSAIFWTGTIVLMNSSINPYVYYWRMKCLRDAVKNTLDNINRIFTLKSRTICKPRLSFVSHKEFEL